MIRILYILFFCSTIAGEEVDLSNRVLEGKRRQTHAVVGILCSKYLDEHLLSCRRLLHNQLICRQLHVLYMSLVDWNKMAVTGGERSGDAAAQVTAETHSLRKGEALRQ